MASTRDRGQAAEDAAVAHLVRRGVSIVERNFRCRIGELDVIAREGDELIFVEVRSRADDAHGDAAWAVGPRKQRQLARVAEAYLSLRQPRFDSCRFDVVAVTGDDIEWFRDAFRIGRI